MVGDDSPDDDTWRRLEAIAASPEAAGRVRLLRLPPLGSIGAAKAAVAAECGGEVLIELDHDDELLPAAVGAVASVFAERPSLDFAYSDVIDRSAAKPGEPLLYPPGWGLGYGAHAREWVEDRPEVVTLSPSLTWETLRHIVSAPNHLRAWRASFYREIGGHDPALPVADDYELVVRSFLAGECARIPLPLYVQYHDPASASRARNAEIQELVSATAAGLEAEIDLRCLELGAVPAGPGDPLTSPEPLHRASALAVPGGERLVSVVIPTFERPEQLERAVESVLAQTHTELEVLVVGDCCPALGDEILGEGDPRVRSANLDRHHGDSGAAPRNFALKTMARGSLVAYLDDDDAWRPTHLADLVRRFDEEPEIAFAFSSYELRGTAVECPAPRRYLIDTGTLMHRAGLLERHGYWRPSAECDGAHDWELVSRWLDAGEGWAATGSATLEMTETEDAQAAAILAAAEQARIGA